MNFFSINFLIFLIVVVAIISKIKSVDVRNYILLCASWIFYACWDWRLLGLLIFISLAAYLGGKYVYNKWAKIISISIPLLSLCICKYLGFFVDTFCNLLSIEDNFSLHIILPLGISFYSFLAISYVLDVNKKKIAAEKEFAIVALYVSFFPTIVSGPITKARDLLMQFKAVQPFNWHDIEIGAQFFILGCLKKFVLADNMGVLVDEVYKTPLVFDSATVWLAVISYSFQLYFDFSGYSDMAIGCGRMMGFKLAENFNVPYIAKNISDFWKRWHISLSSWLQEYLYFALGGSRCGKLQTYRNLMATMLLCGLWHGAAWNFVLWGCLHGLLVCGYHFLRDIAEEKFRLPVIFNVLVTFFLVTMCWIFFRGSDLHNIEQILYRLFIYEEHAVNHMYVWSWLGIIVGIVMGMWTIMLDKWQAKRPVVEVQTAMGFFIICMSIYFLFGLMYTGNNPFVYAAF